MNFTKVQGTGNDFILIEPDRGKPERDWVQTAKAICDRHFGIGGDGLLLVLPSDVADFRMRIFNADGSEAEMCGNGVRCVAKYAFERGLIDTESQEISIETLAGIKRLGLCKSGDKVVGIRVNMGKPIFDAEEIPVTVESDKRELLDIKLISNYPVVIGDRELSLSFVSMGNPHAVYFSQQPVSDFPLSEIGPEVERHEMFPNRVNFEVASVISRQFIEARVWERGAGETLACGTGACAIAVVSQIHGYTDNKVDIKLPGGILNVEWDGTGDVFMSGPAEIVFTGELPE